MAKRITGIGKTLRDIANESLLNHAEKTSLRRIAKEYDTLKRSHDKLEGLLGEALPFVECSNPTQSSLITEIGETLQALTETKDG